MEKVISSVKKIIILQKKPLILLPKMTSFVSFQ